MSTKTDTISIAGNDIEIVRKPIKHMHLSVHPPGGRVRLSAPLDTDQSVLRRFAISKLGWIRKQRKAFKEQPRQSERTFVPGESHYLWGKRYLLKIEETTGEHFIECQGSKHLVMHVQPNTTQENRGKLMKEWYREQLKVEIPALLEKWEPIVGVKTKDWGVKQMRTKWGTCNPDAGRIWLNLELAKKPKSCLEYIVVHELVHLLERRHNERFIAHLDRVMPKWRMYQDELNRLPVAHGDWKY